MAQVVFFDLINVSLRSLAFFSDWFRHVQSLPYGNKASTSFVVALGEVSSLILVALMIVGSPMFLFLASICTRRDSHIAMSICL